MERYYLKYDEDQNRELSLLELDAFMKNHLPILYGAPSTQGVIDMFYMEPNQDEECEIQFPDFMGLLYLCCCEHFPHRLEATYKMHCLPGVSAPSELSFTVANLQQAFGALEQDFLAFDADGNGR
jgi:hypothetical protein